MTLILQELDENGTLSDKKKALTIASDIINPGDEFVVKLDKAVDKRLGMDVDHVNNERGLPICRITEGLAKTWNSQNPDKEVKVGDLILSVNGEGDIGWMLEKCKQDKVLEMRLRRGGK